MPDVLYPTGYGSTMVTMERLRAIYEPRCHPEFARRGFAWVEAQQGRIGIGSGRRIVQPTKPGFAPAGKSFHQDQTFASGIVAYSAWDLVAVNPGLVHRAPTWGEVPPQGSAWALAAKVHCNVNGEPWHMQCIEMDGYDSWVRAGRLDPVSTAPPPPPPPPVSKEPTVILVAAFPVINPGASGEHVATWQRLVNDVHNAGLDADGQYGPASQAVCRVIRVVNGLPAGDVVDDAVWVHSLPKS